MPVFRVDFGHSCLLALADLGGKVSRANREIIRGNTNSDQHIIGFRTHGDQGFCNSSRAARIPFSLLVSGSFRKANTYPPSSSSHHFSAEFAPAPVEQHLELAARRLWFPTCPGQFSHSKRYRLALDRSNVVRNGLSNSPSNGTKDDEQNWEMIQHK